MEKLWFHEKNAEYLQCLLWIWFADGVLVKKIEWNLINQNNPVSEGRLWMFFDFQTNSERDQILCQNM